MTPLFKLNAGAMLASLALFHQAHSADCPRIDAPSYLSIESPTNKASGSSPYRYRFVVRDPQHTHRPFRHGRYQIELTGEATFPDGTHFYRGTTDQRGRTAIFQFKQPVSSDAWYVQPLVGRGDFGESFRFSDGSGCQNALGNLPYMLNEQLGALFCGHTLPDGSTIRYMSTKPSSMQLYDTPTSECRALQRLVNPAMAQSSPENRIKALQNLLKTSRASEHKDLLQGKIDALLIRYGSLTQIKTLVKQKFAAAAPNEQASILNSIAYELLTQRPPRLINNANEMLDQSLAVEENAYNLDSKAWALHLLGRDEEALTVINRSLANFGTICSEEEKDAYPESLAHRGMILWTLKRRSEALDDWTLAHLSTQAGGWANFTPSWNSIEPLIKAREAELKEKGFTAVICSQTAKTNQPDEDVRPGGDPI
jgi:tetratricopeptide (TPR) repeat protein